MCYYDSVDFEGYFPEIQLFSLLFYHSRIAPAIHVGSRKSPPHSGATPLADLEKLLGYRVCDIERHFTDVECFFEL